jgi:hypothetical protein
MSTKSADVVGGRPGVMAASLAVAASTSVPPRPAALPRPSGLPAGLARYTRVLQLVDADSVSRGLAHGTSLGRAPDQAVQLCLDVVRATARALDPLSQIRCGASPATAVCHLDVLTVTGNNQGSIWPGPGGADQVLLEQMRVLIRTRIVATGPGRKRPARPADLVILVGQDQIYASPVRRLRLLGIPTWLIVPGRLVAASLYASACAVSFLGPDSPDLNTAVSRLASPSSSPSSVQGEDHELLLA